jgi:nucleotide-binding universal stress UspA family protein
VKILLATDGSDCSNTAVAECCALVTRPEETEIKILSVCQDMYLFSGEPFAAPPEYLQELADKQRKKAQASITTAEKQIREKLGDSVILVKEIVQGEKAERQIVSEAERWASDMIVVGSHGRGCWGRMLGSVSDGVVHHANCSVLVVR